MKLRAPKTIPTMAPTLRDEEEEEEERGAVNVVGDTRVLEEDESSVAVALCVAKKFA